MGWAPPAVESDRSPPADRFVNQMSFGSIVHPHPDAGPPAARAIACPPTSRTGPRTGHSGPRPEATVPAIGLAAMADMMAPDTT